MPHEVLDSKFGNMGGLIGAMVAPHSCPTRSCSLREEYERAKSEFLRVAEALAKTLIRFEKRGILVDHYVSALSAIAEGESNPVEIARKALRDDPNRLTNQDDQPGPGKEDGR